MYRDAYTCIARRAAVEVSHESCRALVPCWNETDYTVMYRIINRQILRSPKVV